MVQITQKDNVSDVSIKITVETAANWGYDYLNKGNHVKYDISLPPKPFPHDYNLGNSNSGKIDSWVFRITNPLTVDTGYKVRIEWWQRGVKIQDWEDSGTAKAGTMVKPIPGDDAQYS